jgi:uncharacterized protein YecT (DUF1311 family)
MDESGQPQLRLLRRAKRGWVDFNSEHCDLVKRTTLVVRMQDLTVVLSDASSTPLILTSIFQDRKSVV